MVKPLLRRNLCRPQSRPARLQLIRTQGARVIRWVLPATTPTTRLHARPASKQISRRLKASVLSLNTRTNGRTSCQARISLDLESTMLARWKAKRCSILRAKCPNLLRKCPIAKDRKYRTEHQAPVHMMQQN